MLDQQWIFHCKLGHAVQIEPVSGAQSPKNGNFSNIRQRLSAIILRNSPNSVPEDPPPIHKTPLLAGLSGINEGKVSSRWTGWAVARGFELTHSRSNPVSA